MMKQAIIRGVIPFVIMSILSLIMNTQNIDPFQVRSTFIVGIIITFVAAASVIYEIDSWSFTKQLIVHFITMLVTVYPCLLISGWFALNNAVDYLKVLGIFVITGSVLGGIGFLIFGKLLSK